MQSTEYPDLQWIPPKSWTNANRTKVQLIVVHDTEGDSDAQSAEDGAAYNARRTDGTSAHYFHDNTSSVHCVRTEDIAHTARTQGNKRGIHHEACARASWTKAQWLSPSYGRPMLERMAKQCARDAEKWDIPVRKLTVAQVAADVEGFCGHVEITKAFPQDNGTHTDPGPNFPWPEFLAMVQDFLDGDDMDWSDSPWNADYSAAVALQRAYLNSTNILTGVNALTNAVGKVLANVVADDGERDAILAEIEQSRTQLTEAIGQVDEALLAKLGDPATSDEQGAALIEQLLAARPGVLAILKQP